MTDIWKTKEILKIMRDIIVDCNVMHTMTCRIMNSMQYFLKTSIFIIVHILFIIFHICHIFSFPISFKMLSSYDNIFKIITNVSIYSFICLNLIGFCK